MFVWDWTIFVDKEYKKDEEEGKQFYYLSFITNLYNFSWDARRREDDKMIETSSWGSYKYTILKKMLCWGEQTKIGKRE